MIECYVGLGGNIGDTITIMTQTLLLMALIDGIDKLKTSRPYKTSPVSSYPQPNFLNAVCRFQTSLSPTSLFAALQSIEKKMGKTPKPKDAPRIIDIDLLFYGKETYESDDLMIPHPAWHQRLFVLAPLIEVIPKDFFIDVESIAYQLRFHSNEQVEGLDYLLPFNNPSSA